MKKAIVSSSIIFLLNLTVNFTHINFVFADDRQDLIGHELDCVEQHVHQITWSDVCYSDNQLEEKQARAMNQALDEYDGVLSHQDDELNMQDNSQRSDRPLSNVEDDNLISSSKGIHSFDMAGGISFIEYKEPGLMRERGNMYGIDLHYTYRMSENKDIRSLKDVFDDQNKINVYGFDFKYSWGSVDYDSQGTGSADDVEDYMAEIRGIIGYDIPIAQARFTPYTGLGIRYLHDDLRGQSSNGANGYRRESNYLYIPLGLETYAKAKNGIAMDLFLEYDLFLSGKQVSHIEDIPGVGFDKLVNQQPHGYGFKGSFRIIKKNKDVDFYVEPFFNYWHIRKSKISPITINGQLISPSPGLILVGIEPDNNSTEYGIRLGTHF